MSLARFGAKKAPQGTPWESKVEPKTDKNQKMRLFENSCFLVVKAYFLSPKGAKRHPKGHPRRHRKSKKKRSRKKRPKWSPKGGTAILDSTIVEPLGSLGTTYYKDQNRFNKKTVTGYLTTPLGQRPGEFNVLGYY